MTTVIACPESAAPRLRFERGRPEADEVAAVTAVVLALLAQRADTGPVDLTDLTLTGCPRAAARKRGRHRTWTGGDASYRSPRSWQTPI
ncbi:acyl-CoA carboxylase epsilon subunit [Streptomyces sp. MST-110588]|uniref:acyl-CoA carboxylase epsilon subunit n=1 Tax=Streptomyces sp. MST-110588 TaxID=2833628 RepID=UPI001F5E051B|nr:acyl-CoA carboxylase epsilon subunit [Streptomyces sp. MST-110588]UNO39506.1 hypothetical protein KGS77_07695 [Streptomyces sp. MST-110588]